MTTGRRRRQKQAPLTGRRQRQAPLKVEAAFIRSNFYRVVHADGAFGGISPSGNIRMAVYSEAQRLPNLITYDISPTAGVTETAQSPEPNPRDLVRELEVDIVMRLQVARVVRDWLDEKIRVLEEAVGDDDSDSGNEDNSESGQPTDRNRDTKS